MKSDNMTTKQTLLQFAKFLNENYAVNLDEEMVVHDFISKEHEIGLQDLFKQMGEQVKKMNELIVKT